MLVPCVALIGGCPMLGGDGQGDDDVTAHNVTVGPDFGTRTREGTTTGTTEGETCEGFFPAQPNHTLIIDEGLGMTVRVTAIDETRLFILCDDSTFCGETANGVTKFSRFWNRAECDVFIGTTNQGQTLEYSVEFSED